MSLPKISTVAKTQSDWENALWAILLEYAKGTLLANLPASISWALPNQATTIIDNETYTVTSEGITTIGTAVYEEQI